MNRLHNGSIAVLLAALGLLAAVAGCSREELADPRGPQTVTTINNDGTANLEQGDLLVSTSLGSVRYLDAAGNLISEIDPGVRSGVTKDGGIAIPDYLANVDLELKHGMGGLRRFLRVNAPMELPSGTTFVEFVDQVQLSEGMAIHTQRGALQRGDETVTGSAFKLVDAARSTAFHVPAPIAWDANGMNRPWMQYRLALDDAGVLTVGTQVLAAFLTNPDQAYPLTVDPTVTPGAPAPFVASAYLAPTAPGSMTVSLAATYSNAYNDSLEVLIDWGDGSTDTFVTNIPLQILHTYADGTDLVTVSLQLSDFTVDEEGEPAPRTVREELEISLAQSTDDGIPGDGDGDGDGGGEGEEPACGFVHIDEDDLDWSEDRDDDNYARGEDEDEGEALGFDFVLDGQTYSHFNVCSNGWVQLLDGDTEAYDRSRRDEIEDWLEDYVDDADGGAVLFAAMDNWDPSHRDGYYGFQKAEGSVTFFWRAATWRDADKDGGGGGGSSNICEFSIVVHASGDIHFNFSDDNHERSSDELFTGLYLPDAGDWEEGTVVEIARDEFPGNECFSYPGEFDTWHFED